MHIFTAPTLIPAHVRDGSLKSSDALPAAAGLVNGTAIDLGPLTETSSRSEQVELLLTAPALNVAQLPNTVTATYSLQMSNSSNMASPQSLGNSVIVQTGSNGAASTTFRFKVPSNALRYIGAAVTTAAGAGNCAAAAMTLELLF